LQYSIYCLTPNILLGNDPDLSKFNFFIMMGDDVVLKEDMVSRPTEHSRAEPFRKLRRFGGGFAFLAAETLFAQSTNTIVILGS
jgi:hypothetical protein